MMKGLWEYISAKAKYALSPRQVMSRIMFVLGIFNMGLLIFFVIFSIYPMVLVSMFSVTLYIYCFIQASRDKNLLPVFNLSYAEIMIHAVASVLLLGVDSGFSLYIIAMLPLGYYASYNFSSEKKSVNPMLYVLFSGVAFCFARILGSSMHPLYSYGNKSIDRAMYMVNYFVAVIAIVLFFSTLLNQIKYLESQQKNQNKKLEELSKTDALTGLANRRSIQERYEDSELLQESYAVILADIDDFKKVNDTYGHDAGDRTLKAVSAVFKNAVRGEDIVCRWGGEEILVFLPKCPLENAKDRAEAILQNIRKLQLTTQEHSSFGVTMTFGVAISEEAGSFTEVVQKADERLYTGKQTGKNQVV